MNDSYFWFLVDYIDGYGYEGLLLAMWEKPFFVKVKLDDNLIRDAYYFRKDHSRGNRSDDANCLEILIQLAIKMDSVLYDSKHGIRTEEWFWHMLGNMGLMQYDNPNFDENAVDKILEKFVNRRFKRNGEGGPFPLERPVNSCRTTCWWYNLNAYLDENFKYEFENTEEYDDE